MWGNFLYGPPRYGSGEMPIIETLTDVTRLARDQSYRAKACSAEARQSVKLAKRETREIVTRSRETLGLKLYPY